MSCPLEEPINRYNYVINIQELCSSCCEGVLYIAGKLYELLFLDNAVERFMYNHLLNHSYIFLFELQFLVICELGIVS